MVKLLIGHKGSGKTKRMIELANETVQTARGSIVFINKNSRLIYDLDLLDEARKNFKSEVPVSHDSVKEDRLDVIVGTHDTEKEADVFVFICDMRKVLHAHYSDLIIEIIDQS